MTRKKKEEKVTNKEFMESGFRVGKLMGEIVGAEEERTRMQHQLMMRQETAKKNYEYLFNQIFFTFMFVGNLLWFGLMFGKILDTAFSNIAILWILIFAMNVYMAGYFMFRNAAKNKAQKNE